MNISSYADRVGGFVATNSGIIENCYTESVMTGKQNIAGFVYENMGKVNFSISKNKMKAGKNIGAFFCKNKGEVVDCAWINALKKKKEVSGEDTDESTVESENDKISLFADELDTAMEKLHLGGEWELLSAKGKNKLLPNFEKLYYTAEDIPADVTEISDADTLFSLAAAIASGDTDAAEGTYRLTKDINMHGKKWLPIGLSDQAAFKGIFDGAGHRVYNFTVKAAKLDNAGFFGYVKGGKVFNLNLDCIVSGKDGSVTGGMVGVNDKGVFINCHVRAKVEAEKCFGGFAGKNMGIIAKSSFTGKVSHIIPIIVFWLPPVIAGLALLGVGAGVIVHNYKHNETPYKPEIIDPNQRPVIEESTKFDPPPAGSNRISFELNQEVYIDANTHVGGIDYVNPSRSTQDVVISVRITDAELLKVIGRTGRTEKEQAKLEAEENYDPANHYHELYRSGRLQIGFGIADMKISALADGTYLPVGDYEMIVAIDAYNPETHEKAVVSAQAPITAHVVVSKPQA